MTPDAPRPAPLPADHGRRVVIAGGSGLIGRALTEELIAAGWEVVILSRSPDRVDGLPADARAVRWDAESADGWLDEADGAAALINLTGENVAEGRWSEAKKRRIRSSRLDSTGAMVAAVETLAQEGRAVPPVLLQGSAVGYYGPRGDDVVTEDDPPGDDFLARVTVDWEAASEPVDAHGVTRMLLRTGVVLTPEGGALPRMATPFRFFLGAPLGSGDQWVPWIHGRDEVRAIHFLLERGLAAVADAEESRALAGPYNLTAPEPVTNRELSRALADALGRPLGPVGVPRFALKLAAGELAEVLLTGQRAVPRRLEALGFEFLWPAVGPALEDLLG